MTLPVVVINVSIRQVGCSVKGTGTTILKEHVFTSANGAKIIGQNVQLDTSTTRQSCERDHFRLVQNRQITLPVLKLLQSEVIRLQAI